MQNIVIIGGGISGLYCAYQLSKAGGAGSILVLEKSGDLGGRVHTYVDKNMTVEAGAGRFHQEHRLLMELIRDFGLVGKMVPTAATAVFAPSDGTGSIMNSLLDAPDTVLTGFMGDVAVAALDTWLGKENIPSSGLIARVIVASKLKSVSYLRNISFLDFAKTVLNKREVQFVVDTFGYYSELVIMNAYDSIQLMGELGPGQQFYTLTGGLSQIIDGLRDRCLANGVRILRGKSVHRVEYDAGGVGGGLFAVYCQENKRPYLCNRCICAVPKQVVAGISFVGLGVRGWKKNLGDILCAPLCRIYAKYPVKGGGAGGGAGGGPWFRGFPKMTTNNPLRMIIPISEKNGIIMISYSDNIFAKYWKKIFDKGGIRAVEREIMRLVQLSSGVSIPVAISMKMFYWDCGVGYWGVGANNAVFREKMLRPAGDSIELYLCGEHYSARYQQWMEGALETAVRVIDCIV
jgi:monoamine oxidase